MPLQVRVSLIAGGILWLSLIPRKSDQGNQERVQTLVKGKSRSDSGSQDPQKSKQDKEQSKTEPGGWMKSHLHTRQGGSQDTSALRFMSGQEQRLGKMSPFSYGRQYPGSRSRRDREAGIGWTKLKWQVTLSAIYIGFFESFPKSGMESIVDSRKLKKEQKDLSWQCSG